MALAIPLTVIAALATACGGSGSGKSSSGGAALAAANINPAPYDQVKQGGTLHLAQQQMPVQYNFFQPDGNDGTAPTAFPDLVLPGGPFIADAKGNLTADPDWVTSAQVTSQSPMTVEYKLNPKAHWSNGTPITETDYETQWKALNGSNPKFDTTGPAGYSQISSVTQGTDKFDVIVKFSQPFGDWQTLFGPLYPAKAMDTPADFDNYYKTGMPLTAGPFKLGGINTSAQTDTFVRDPSWWGRPAKLDTIIFTHLDSQAAIQAYANGEIDNVQALTTAQYDSLKNTPNSKLLTASSNQWQDIVFNGKTPITGDINVRHALMLGLDRQAFIDGTLKGLPVPKISPMNNHFMLPQQAGYADTSGLWGKYDPTEAKKLLDKDGWKVGPGGVRVKNGKQMTLSLPIPAGYPTQQISAQLIQGLYKNLGVKVNVSAVNSDDYFSKYINVGNFDIARFTSVDNAWPVSTNVSSYLNPQGSNTFQNFGQVGSPQIDALMNKALADTNVAQERQDIVPADKAIWNIGQGMSIFEFPDLEFVKKNLANYGAFGIGTIDWTQVGFTS